VGHSPSSANVALDFGARDAHDRDGSRDDDVGRHSSARRVKRVRECVRRDRDGGIRERRVRIDREGDQAIGEDARRRRRSGEGEKRERADDARDFETSCVDDDDDDDDDGG